MIRKRKPGREVLHGADKPAHCQHIDFDKLDLKYKLTKATPVEYVVPKLQWTSPPKSPPDLPFRVDRTAQGNSG